MYWKRVLIVEDDPFLRQLLADVLGREYEVFLAGDGNEGFLAALAVGPDAVVTDLMMPSSGLELIRGLYAEASTRAIPVVIMTAISLDLETRRFLAQEGNVRDCFQKGDELETLRAKVSGLFLGQPAHA